MNGKARKYDLLSRLCHKYNYSGHNNDGAIFVLKAIDYLEGISDFKISDDLRKNYGETDDKKVDNEYSIELLQCIEKFSPNKDSAEEKLLKKEIINTLEKTPTSAHCLLQNCKLWKPFHCKRGRTPEEDFFSEVFCFVFNNSTQFRQGILDLIKENTEVELGSNSSAKNQNAEDLNKIIDNGDNHEKKKNIRWDIKITDNSKTIVIENKVGAPFGDKETSEYLQAAKIGKHDGYILLTCNSNEVFNDCNFAKIKHISWFDGDDSILEILKKGISSQNDEYENLYMKYFIELINSVASSFSRILTFRESNEKLKKINLLDKFNEIKDRLGNAYKPQPGKMGYIFSLEEYGVFPFRINTTGVFYIQWVGGTLRSERELKESFKTELQKSDNIKELLGDKYSFNIESLSEKDIAIIKNATDWLNREVCKKFTIK